MTNEKLYLVIGAPMLFNAVLIGLLLAYINAKFEAVSARFDSVDSRFDSVDSRFESVNHRLESVNQRFDAIDRRFDEMRDLWRAELRRVEEVIDARLKHLEER